MRTEDLKKLKEESNLTTKQISDLSGIPESTISRVLSGQTDNPTFETICAIVKAMGGSLDKLTDIQPDSNTSDLSQLIVLYERIIKKKDWYIRMLVIICCALVAILILLLLVDVLCASVGLVRY